VDELEGVFERKVRQLAGGVLSELHGSVLDGARKRAGRGA
jgi:hypothetical protein